MRKVLISAVVLVALAGAAFGYRQYMISQLRQPVLAQLADPDSALFKNERYVGNWTVTGGIYCGQVNAKNKMGGYVGYRWFTGESENSMIEDESMAKTFDDAKIERCNFDSDKLPFWYLRR